MTVRCKSIGRKGVVISYGHGSVVVSPTIAKVAFDKPTLLAIKRANNWVLAALDPTWPWSAVMK